MQRYTSLRVEANDELNSQNPFNRNSSAYEYCSNRCGWESVRVIRKSATFGVKLRRRDSDISNTSSIKLVRSESESKIDALRSMKAEFAKTKAVLEQKLEFQEIELNEMKGKLTRDKQTYETMLVALKANTQPKHYKNLEIIKQIHEKQMEEER
jgi:hypothetical protein